MATKPSALSKKRDVRLRALKKDEKTSFSDIIVKYYPVKRKLSYVLAELGDCNRLADSVETGIPQDGECESSQDQVLNAGADLVV